MSKASTSLSGNLLPTHCLLRTKANLVCFCSPSSLSFDLHDCLCVFCFVFFVFSFSPPSTFLFPLHRLLACQPKNETNMSKDWKISPRALQSRSPCSHSWVCPLGPTRRPHCLHIASSGCVSSSLKQRSWDKSPAGSFLSQSCYESSAFVT